MQEIVWLPWRGKTGKLGAWSGLVEEDGRLALKLNPDDENPRFRARLEVRWEARPETLAKNAVDYLVEVRAGQDVLADRTVPHSGKSPQKCVFNQEDFGELEENARFDAQVFVRALGHDLPSAESEDFLICYGLADKPARSAAGSVYPTLALAVIQVAPDMATWERFAAEPGNRHLLERDKKGFIACRGPQKSARVYGPPLLDRLAADWAARQGQPGRWRLTVRVDGSAVGEPEFLPCVHDGSGDRFAKASRTYAEKLAGAQGPLGLLYTDAAWVTDYVNAAISLWESGLPDAATLHTLEVVDVGGTAVGVIVLPTHPLRVAWQQGFDLLAMRHRYEEGLPPARVAKLLEVLISVHLPAFLPGFKPDDTLVFADSLGFHAAAMVHANDPEPKSTVALLARLLGSEDSVAPTVGRGAATLLSEEIGRYLALHPDTRRVRIHALRAGDGLTVARAMGQALKSHEQSDEIGDGDEPKDGRLPPPQPKLAYALDLYSAGSRPEWSGRFLTATAAKRRAGAGVVPEEDRWLLDSVTRPGGVSLPRLQWARRRTPYPDDAAHLALVFDVFPSRVEAWPTASFADKGTFEVHGLSLTLTRNFRVNDSPRWEVHVPPEFEGEKHPVARTLSERLVRAHTMDGVEGRGPTSWRRSRGLAGAGDVRITRAGRGIRRSPPALRLGDYRRPQCRCRVFRLAARSAGRI